MISPVAPISSNPIEAVPPSSSENSVRVEVNSDGPIPLTVANRQIGMPGLSRRQLIAAQALYKISLALVITGVFVAQEEMAIKDYSFSQRNSEEVNGLVASLILGLLAGVFADVGLERRHPLLGGRVIKNLSHVFVPFLIFHTVNVICSMSNSEAEVCKPWNKVLRTEFFAAFWTVVSGLTRMKRSPLSCDS